MEMIFSRNPQGAMAPLLSFMHTAGELEGDNLVIDSPVTFVYNNPRERLIFWPQFRRNPAQELYQALGSLAEAEKAIPEAAQAILTGATHFIFSTPQLVVQAKISSSGRLDMYVIVSEENPFVGALGQLGMQLTVLQELIAGAAKKPVGYFTIQHMQLRAPAMAVGQLLKAAFDEPVLDLYETGDIKTRRIDGPLDIKVMIAEETPTGLRSKWARKVMLPLIACGKCEDVEEARKMAENIKAADIRRAMVEWTEAVIEAKKAESK